MPNRLHSYQRGQLRQLQNHHRLRKVRHRVHRRSGGSFLPGHLHRCQLLALPHGRRDLLGLHERLGPHQLHNLLTTGLRNILLFYLLLDQHLFRLPGWLHPDQQRLRQLLPHKLPAMFGLHLHSLQGKLRLELGCLLSSLLQHCQLRSLHQLISLRLLQQWIHTIGRLQNLQHGLHRLGLQRLSQPYLSRLHHLRNRICQVCRPFY